MVNFDLFSNDDNNIIVPKVKQSSSSKKAKPKKDTKLEDQSSFIQTSLILTEDDNKKIKELSEKINQKKSVSEDISKLLKSKSVDLTEKLQLITNKVLSVLGKQRNNIVVIKNKQDYLEYIDKAIASGRIAIDTETNNTTDAINCKLMGLCLYYPGGKQAYIPVNHINIDTKIRLDWQLNEDEIAEGLAKIVAARKNKQVFILMHNGKFDYKVLKSTCGVEVVPDWDTIIAARLLNENDLSGLKYLYTTYIDASQSKYDIEDLFEGFPYAVIDPEIFALYAATDAMMTDKVYLWELPQMIQANTEAKISGSKHGLYWLFTKVEMPIVVVTAEMELYGVNVDQEFGAQLKKKYEVKLAEVDKKIAVELDSLKPVINAWKLTKEANEKTKVYVPEKTKMTQEKIEKTYPEVELDAKGNETGKRYKWGKSKVAQLEDPIKLSSPVQLAILFYDILQCKPVSISSPRGTGVNEMKLLAKALSVKSDYDDDVDTDEEDNDIDTLEDFINSKQVNDAAGKICKLILDRRGIMKLITTYIDVIPALASRWSDGRIHTNFNTLGAKTGRFSSGGKLHYMDDDYKDHEISLVNLQNIPSHEKSIRMLFKGAETGAKTEVSDLDYYEVTEIQEVETDIGWKFAKDLAIGDVLITSDGLDKIKNITKQNDVYLLYV